MLPLGIVSLVSCCILVAAINQCLTVNFYHFCFCGEVLKLNSC